MKLAVKRQEIVKLHNHIKYNNNEHHAQCTHAILQSIFSSL